MVKKNVKISLQIADCNDYDQKAPECTAKLLLQLRSLQYVGFATEIT